LGRGGGLVNGRVVARTIPDVEQEEKHRWAVWHQLVHTVGRGKEGMPSERLLPWAELSAADA
jgi:hypothetical protein